MKKKLIRPLHAEVRILDEARGRVEYVASDATLDSYQEVVDPNGWRFERFAKNAPFVDSHRYDSVQDMIGSVVSARVEDGQLIEVVEYAKDLPEHTLAKLAWGMVKGGHLKAVSVGFIPEDWADARDPRTLNEHAERLKLTADVRKKVRRIYLRQQQIELSQVVIGANPAALLRAYEEGDVSEGLLAEAGFGTDEVFDIMQQAAAVCADPEADKFLKGMVGIFMRRTFLDRNQSPTTPTKRESPDGTDGAAAARAQWRARFIEGLQEATGRFPAGTE